MPRESFKQVAARNVSDWESLAEEDKILAADAVAVFLFYLGDLEYARKVSYSYSLFRESRDRKGVDWLARIHALFSAGLYASLAQAQTVADEHWQNLVERRRVFFSEDRVREPQTANIWIYEAYALMKLRRYNEVEQPAKIGFEGLLAGLGLYSSPRYNEIEYGLVNVMLTLSNYLLHPTEIGKQQAQQALITYKEENTKYSKRGYAIIFDLQFSYPKIFTPVLPGPDPEKD